MAYLERTITERNKQYVFGVPLEKLMSMREDNTRDVPPVLMDAATYVKRNCVGSEGIFRLSSSTADLESAREDIDAGNTPRYNDVYLAANVIKLWLRSLPEPLMTFELYDKWIAAKDNPVGLKKVLMHLPFVNRFVLCEIMSLMSALEKEKDTTKMNASNLAIVMTPNLLYQKERARFSAEPQEVIETLILNYSTIFEETEALRERQRTERVSARHARRGLRSLATSKSLASQGSVKERRPIAPSAMALKASFNLAAPQDIGPPPPPVDNIPPPPAVDSITPTSSGSDVPDIGPPVEAPPPLMPPASPMRGSSSAAYVLPGFSQSFMIPPPSLSPVLSGEVIPPPPSVDGAEDSHKVPTVPKSSPNDLGKSESGSSSRKHSRHKSSTSGSALVLKDAAEGEKKKKHHHHKDKDKDKSSRSSTRVVRDRGESLASASEAKKDDSEVEGVRVRAVSEWSDTRTEEGKSLSAIATPGESLASDDLSQSSEIPAVDSLDAPQSNTEQNKPGDNIEPPPPVDEPAP